MDGGMISCRVWGAWGTNRWRFEEGQISKPVSLLTVSRWHPTILALSWVTTSPSFPRSSAPWLAGPNCWGTGSPGGGRIGLDTIGRGGPCGGLCTAGSSTFEPVEVIMSSPKLGRSPLNSLARVVNLVAIIWLIWKWPNNLRVKNTFIWTKHKFYTGLLSDWQGPDSLLEERKLIVTITGPVHVMQVHG